MRPRTTWAQHVISTSIGDFRCLVLRRKGGSEVEVSTYPNGTQSILNEDPESVAQRTKARLYALRATARVVYPQVHRLQSSPATYGHHSSTHARIGRSINPGTHRAPTVDSQPYWRWVLLRTDLLPFVDSRQNESGRLLLGGPSFAPNADDETRHLTTHGKRACLENPHRMALPGTRRMMVRWTV